MLYFECCGKKRILYLIQNNIPVLDLVERKLFLVCSVDKDVVYDVMNNEHNMRNCLVFNKHKLNKVKILYGEN